MAELELELMQSGSGVLSYHGTGVRCPGFGPNIVGQLEYCLAFVTFLALVFMNHLLGWNNFVEFRHIEFRTVCVGDGGRTALALPLLPEASPGSR